jgi:hypothetical protein
MLVERQDTCLGNSPRERNKDQVKLTFWKLRSIMLKKKVKKMGNP